jgi:hypothetical protein
MKLQSLLTTGVGLLTIGCSLFCLNRVAHAQTAVSIRSLNYPDLYIRHKNFAGYLETANDDLSAKDASYKLVPGLANKNCTSLESINFPGYFLRHQNLRIKLSPKVNSTPTIKQVMQGTNDSTFAADATFCRKIGVYGQKGISFESANMPGYFIRHKNFELWIDRSNGTDLFRKDATFSLVDSLAK